MPFNDLEKFATVFFDKCTLGKIIGKYIVLHECDKCLMVLRPYQFYAVMKEIKDLEAKRADLDKEIEGYLKELGLVE